MNCVVCSSFEFPLSLFFVLLLSAIYCSTSTENASGGADWQPSWMKTLHATSAEWLAMVPEVKQSVIVTSDVQTQLTLELVVDDIHDYLWRICRTFVVSKCLLKGT